MISRKCQALFVLCASTLWACGGAPTKPVVEPKKEVVVEKAPEPVPDPIAVHVCSQAKDPVEKGRPIRVEIRGIAAPALLCERFPIRAGGDLDDSTTDANIRSLYGEGRVEDVVVFKEMRPEGIVVVYDVKIRKRIGSVKVRPVGNLEQSIVDQLVTDAPSWENNAEFDALTRQVQNTLANFGYRHANITVETTPEGNESVNVVLAVEPGVRTSVGSLTIEGVSTERLSQIQPLLRTKVGEPFNRELFERDVLVITADLFERGLLGAEFSNPDIVESQDGSKVDIRLKVTEGPVYKLRNVKFVGDLLGPQTTYLKGPWRTKPGAIFSRRDILTNVDRVKELHASRGATVDVEIDTVLDSKAHTVDVTVKIRRP